MICLGCLTCLAKANFEHNKLPQPIPDEELEDLDNPDFQNNLPIDEIEDIWGDLNQPEFQDNIPFIEFDGPYELDREEWQLHNEQQQVEQPQEEAEYRGQGLGYRLQSQMIPPTIGDVVVITSGRLEGVTGTFQSISRNRAVVLDQHGITHNVAMHLIQVTDQAQGSQGKILTFLNERFCLNFNLFR